MHLIFSKIILLCLAPLNWILALLIWNFLIKKAIVKKRLTIAIIALVMFFGNEIIYTKLVVLWQPKQVRLNEMQNYEAGILLGGLSSFDKYGNGYLNSASDRLIETSILYETKKIKKIIISGGSITANRPKEADFLFKELQLLGIPERDLLVENQSRTTYENAIYTKRIIDSVRLTPPYVLITSAMHIPRAEKVFAKAGLRVFPFPSDYHVFDKKFDFADYVVPKMNVMNDWASFLKEVIGIWGYKLFKMA